MPSDKASICRLSKIPLHGDTNPASCSETKIPLISGAPWCRVPGHYLLIVLQHLRHSKGGVIFIAVKKEKAVTLCQLLPCVFDSFLLIHGCPELLKARVFMLD